MRDKKNLLESFDIKFMRLDPKHFGLARPASPFPTLFLVSPDKHDIKRHQNSSLYISTLNWVRIYLYYDVILTI